MKEIRSIATCTTVGTDARTDRIGSIVGVIADVDLTRSEAKRCLREFSEGWGSQGALGPLCPLVYFTGSNALELAADARRLGATACISADSEPRVIVGPLANQIWPDKSLTELGVQREAERVGLVVRDMLATAGMRGRIDLQGVDSAIEPVLAAIQEGGLAHWLSLVWTHDDLTLQHCLLVTGVTAHFARHLVAVDRRSPPDDARHLAA